MLYKKIFLFAIASTLILSSVTPSFAHSALDHPQVTYNASSGETYQSDARFQGIISITTRLIEDPVGYASPVYTFASDLTKIDRYRVKTVLQKYDNGWKDVKNWDKTILINGQVQNYYEEFKVVDKNKSYRFIFEIQAKMGNTTIDESSGESLARVF